MLLFLWICLFWSFHINGIIQYVTFHVRLPSLGIMFLRSIHFVACVSTLSLFYGWIRFLCKDGPYLANPFIGWWAFGEFPPSGCCELCCHEQVHIFFCLPVFSSLGCPHSSGIAGSIVCHIPFWPECQHDGSHGFQAQRTLSLQSVQAQYLTLRDCFSCLWLNALKQQLFYDLSWLWDKLGSFLLQGM